MFFVISCGPTPKELVLAGDEKKNAHDYNSALADYSSAILAKPEMYQAWHNRGECQMNLGFYDLALQDFDEALKIKPGFPASLYNKGICLLKLKKYPEALPYFEKACASDTTLRADLALADCYFYSGKNKIAIHHFTKALETYPDSSGIYLGRGLAFYQSGNTEAALADISTYLEKGGTDPVAYRQLGLIWLKKSKRASQVDTSILYLEQFQAKVGVADPETKKALILSYLARGKMLLTVRKEIEAMADFSRVIELDPSNAEAYYHRGRVLVALGQIVDGCLDLQNALKNGNVEAKKLVAMYCGEVL